MTYAQIAEMVEETNLPVAYDHFAEGDSPDPPFLVFLMPQSSGFYADGRLYYRETVLALELYTDKKDPPLEARVEAVLDAHDINFQKSETWIETEKLYEVIYETEVPYGE